MQRLRCPRFGVRRGKTQPRHAKRAAKSANGQQEEVQERQLLDQSFVLKPEVNVRSGRGHSTGCINNARSAALPASAESTFNDSRQLVSVGA